MDRQNKQGPGVSLPPGQSAHTMGRLAPPYNKGKLGKLGRGLVNIVAFSPGFMASTHTCGAQGVTGGLRTIASVLVIMPPRAPCGPLLHVPHWGAVPGISARLSGQISKRPQSAGPLFMYTICRAFLGPFARSHPKLNQLSG